MIDKLSGPFPFWMANRCCGKFEKNFAVNEDYFVRHGTYFDWPRFALNIQSVQKVKDFQKLEVTIIFTHFSFQFPINLIHFS